MYTLKYYMCLILQKTYLFFKNESIFIKIYTPNPIPISDTASGLYCIVRLYTKLTKRTRFGYHKYHNIDCESQPNTLTESEDKPIPTFFLRSIVFFYVSTSFSCMQVLYSVLQKSLDNLLILKFFLKLLLPVKFALRFFYWFINFGICFSPVHVKNIAAFHMYTYKNNKC